MKQKFKDKGSPVFNNRSGVIFANIMVLTALIHFCIWYVFLNAQTIVLAFKSTPDGSGALTLINFKQLFNEFSGRVSGNANIFNALKNTFKYFGLGIFKLCLSYCVAYFFFKKVYGHGVLKYIFFIPSMISPTVITTVFKEFINPTGSVGLALYNAFGYQLPNLLTNNASATATMMAYVLWVGFGIQFMIFVGAMNRIPSELFEVGKLDGLGITREVLQIVVPLTWDTFVMYLLSAISGMFMSSGPILFFMGTQPYLDVYTVDFFIFSQTNSGLLNYPAAIGLFFSVVAVPFVVAARVILKRINKDIQY